MLDFSMWKRIQSNKVFKRKERSDSERMLKYKNKQKPSADSEIKQNFNFFRDQE